MKFKKWLTDQSHLQNQFANHTAKISRIVVPILVIGEILNRLFWDQLPSELGFWLLFAGPRILAIIGVLLYTIPRRKDPSLQIHYLFYPTKFIIISVAIAGILLLALHFYSQCQAMAMNPDLDCLKNW